MIDQYFILLFYLVDHNDNCFNVVARFNFKGMLPDVCLTQTDGIEVILGDNFVTSWLNHHFWFLSTDKFGIVGIDDANNALFVIKIIENHFPHRRTWKRSGHIRILPTWHWCSNDCKLTNISPWCLGYVSKEWINNRSNRGSMGKLCK